MTGKDKKQKPLTPEAELPMTPWEDPPNAKPKLTYLGVLPAGFHMGKRGGLGYSTDLGGG